MSVRPPFRSNPEFRASGLPDLGPPRGPVPLRRYKVVLHRTADTGLMHVARAVRELTRYGEAEANHRMWEVHHSGRAVVVVTHLERAELYVEQFAERELFASVEAE